jgi:hypothetical protein
MSNKKRIKNKVDSIKRKKQLKLFSLACEYATKIINAAIEEARARHQISLKYPSGGFIPNNREPEKIVDSHGDEMIMPKFELRDILYFLNTHKPE